MQVKSLLLLAILFLFYTCKKDEEKITQFSVGLTALDGGSVNSSGGVFNEGETITVTATPKEGYEFVRWDFSDSSTSSENPIKIIVSSDLVVSAVFQEEKKYSLAINIQGLGSVEKEIVNTNTITNDDSFADGTVIKLTPIPKKDESFFSNWSGDVTGSDNSIQITMNESKSVTATFQYNLYKDIIGKWDSDITQKSIQTTSKHPSISVNFIIFNANNTFAVGLNIGIANGTYQIVSNNRLNFTSWQSNLPAVLSFLISSQNFGSLSFISITNNTLSAALGLPTIPNINLKNYKKNTNYNPKTQSFSQGSSTASSTSASCGISLDQGDPDQRIDKGDEISNIIYKAVGCNSISLTATSTLPPGVNFATNQISSDVILGIISGRPTDQASGTYYYSFTNDNTVSGKITVGSSTTASSTSNTSTSTDTIYFENGICKCPNAQVGETATISGTLYTVVDNSTIAGEINNNNVNLCTTLVTNMSSLFYNKSSFNSNISFWDTSNVTNMTTMFERATSFNQPINNWNVSNVTAMGGMFFGARSFNQPINNWNVSNVTDMGNMFRNATSFNQPIGGWDTSNVTNMSEMFSALELGSAFNQNISGWNTSKVTDMTQMFAGTTSFNQPIGGWDTSNVTNMRGMFWVATAFNQDINSWDVSKVTNMGSMFHASSFNKPLNNWNVSSVSIMSQMFQGASAFNQPIGNWDVSSVTLMFRMFRSASSFNQDLSSWCVSNFSSEPSNFSNNSALTNSNKPKWGEKFTVALTSGAQSQTVTVSNAIAPIVYTATPICSGLTSVNASNLPTGVSASLANNIVTISGTPSAQSTGVFNYSITLTGSSTNQTVSGTLNVIEPVSTIYFENGTCKCPNASAGDTATINGTTYTVVNDSTIAGQINNGNVNLCTTLVTNMFNLFNNKTSFNSDISFWDTSNVTNMQGMFLQASNFDKPLSNWNVSNVTTMQQMFDSASSFNQPLNNWNVSNVTNMSGIFARATSFNQPIGNWNVSNVTNMGSMFYLATSFNQPIGNWNTSNVTNMIAMFLQASNFDKPLSNWNVSNVTTMQQMFDRASSFNQPLNNWNVSNVTNMQGMFQYAPVFNQLLNNWNVSNVTYMENMFRSASSFNQPLNNWNVSNVTGMNGMFDAASNFNQPLNNWNVSNVTYMENMFRSASAFNQPLNNWNVSSVSIMRRMFGGAISFNQNIGGWNVSNITNMDGMFEVANQFNQNLSGWCVNNISSEPSNFSNNSALTNSNKPLWGKQFTVAFTSGTQSQTVTVTNAITPIVYTATPKCSGVTSINASNLPAGVSASLSNDVVTISGTPSAQSTGVFNYSITLTGSSSSTTVVGSINVVEPSTATYNINVTASNASNYTLSGSDRTGQVSGNDPGITINLGDTLNFIVNAPGHPFYLKTVAGTGTGNTVSGASNNGTTNQTVSWTPTQAGTYYYICSLHGGMVGTITVN